MGTCATIWTWSHGDRASKLSAFWTMLTLSGIIAVAGPGDSTATPSMSIALGIVRSNGGLAARSCAFVAGGVILVIAIGLLASTLLPRTANLLTNPQVTGRTSLTLVDMIAALATGLAGPSPSRHTGMRRRWHRRASRLVSCAAAAHTQPSLRDWCSTSCPWWRTPPPPFWWPFGPNASRTPRRYGSDRSPDAGSPMWSVVSRTAVIGIACPGDPSNVTGLMKTLEGQVPDGVPFSSTPPSADRSRPVSSARPPDAAMIAPALTPSRMTCGLTFGKGGSAKL